MKTLLYTILVHCPYTFESERHCCITKCAKWGDEGCLDLIFDLEGDLMIPRVTIQESQENASRCGVHDLINSGQAKWICFAGTIVISIINTHPPIFILFYTSTRLASQSR
jgi:hypothetical protein